MSALRSINPIAMADVVPKAPATPVPELTMIAPEDVLVDERYQRNLSERSKDLIRRIVTEFDWRRWRPPVCTWTPEGLTAIDGQHSLVAAASHPLIAEVPVMIVAAETLQDRAATFIGINSDRLAVTKMQMHAAAVVAGDPDAVRVQALLDRHGIRVLKSCPNKRQEYQPRETVAVAAIRALVDRRGEVAAETIIRVLADAECAPIKEVGIRAVERLLFDPEFAGQVEVADLIERVAASRLTAERDARVFAATHGVPWWHGLAAVWFRKVKKARAPSVDQGQNTTRATSVANGLESKPAPQSTTSPGPAETESKPDRAPGKGAYQASAPSVAGRLRDRDSAAPIPAPRPQAQHVIDLPGTPPPGRSALDQRRSAGS